MTPTTTDYTRDEAVAEIKALLKARTGRSWSVRGGRGTAWGWIFVTDLPRNRVVGAMTDDARRVLAEAFGLDDVHYQGISIPDSSAHRREYVSRLKGEPFTVAAAYWD